MLHVVERDFWGHSFFQLCPSHQLKAACTTNALQHPIVGAIPQMRNKLFYLTTETVKESMVCI